MYVLEENVMKQPIWFCGCNKTLNFNYSALLDGKCIMCYEKEVGFGKNLPWYPTMHHWLKINIIFSVLFCIAYFHPSSRHVKTTCPCTCIMCLRLLRALCILCPLLVHLLLPQGDNGDKSVIKLHGEHARAVWTHTPAIAQVSAILIHVYLYAIVYLFYFFKHAIFYRFWFVWLFIKSFLYV